MLTFILEVGSFCALKIKYLKTTSGIDGLFSTAIEGDVGYDPNLMTLQFGQPSLGLPSPEYYESEVITDLYRNTLERLLITLAEKEEALVAEEQLMDPSALTVHEERLRVWPPWPWPPWEGDDDDDDDGGDDDDHRKPGNRTERARKLAKNIINFEKKIANISLDLYVVTACANFDRWV